jgi:deoxyribose-phosphate aldolase
MIDQITPVQLARMIDISAVQAFNTVEDVVGLARVAIEQKFVAAHVLPAFVAILRDQLSGS